MGFYYVYITPVSSVVFHWYARYLQNFVHNFFFGYFIGHLHNPGGHPMAVDSPRLRSEFHSELAVVCRDLVAHRLHPWGLRAAQPKQLRLESLCRQHQLFHILFPLQHWNSAHNWIWLEVHHRRVPGGYLCHVPSKHHRCLHSGGCQAEFNLKGSNCIFFISIFVLIHNFSRRSWWA